MASFSIPARFCGPPTSGHGGWTSGALAELVGGRVEVTLRNPPPLDTELTVVTEGDLTRVLHGDLLVAECEPTDEPTEAPAFVDLDTARAAATHYVGLTRAPFSTCFGCGASRDGDALRIFPGLIEDRELVVAAPLEAPADLVTAEGTLPVPVIWSALDCPSIWPYMSVVGFAALLGRMRVDLHAPVPAGEPLVVVGQGNGGEGRKRYCSGAIYTAEGDLLASSHTTWITVDRPPAGTGIPESAM